MRRVIRVTFTIDLAPEEAPAAVVEPGPPAAPELAPSAPDVRPPLPWEPPVSPEIAACRLCDYHGLVDVWDPEGARLVIPCVHDEASLSAVLERKGYQRVRQDHSRPPPGAPDLPGGAP